MTVPDPNPSMTKRNKNNDSPSTSNYLSDCPACKFAIRKGQPTAPRPKPLLGRVHEWCIPKETTK